MTNCVMAKKEKVPYRVIEGEAVIVDVAQGDVTQLNDVASFIWEEIDGIKCVDDIVERVCGEFEVDEEQARIDVYAFIEELKQKKIVVAG